MKYYCFSTATISARMRLNFTSLIDCVFCYLVIAIFLLKCTQQIETHNTGVHVMAKAAQTTAFNHAMGCQCFRSAELTLLLLDQVIIERRRCLTNYLPCRRQFPAPLTEFPSPIKHSTLSTPTETNSLPLG
jgi:hypothetical protein